MGRGFCLVFQHRGLLVPQKRHEQEFAPFLFLAALSKSGDHKMKADNKITSGFTLVKAVIAAVVLILSLTALTVSFVQSRRSAAITDNMLNTVHAARAEMETLISYSYYAPELNAGIHGFTNGVYTGSYTISNNTTDKVKDIVVTVMRVNPRGKTTPTSIMSLAGSMSSELHQ